MKKYILAFLMVLIMSSLSYSQPFTIFSENMGNVDVSSNTAVNSHTGFQNSGSVTFNGTADVRNTVVSIGSGGNNVFLTNSGLAYFKISAMNIDGASAMNLKFLVHKNTNAENGSNLKINMVIDAQTSVPLTFTSLTTGTSSTGWYPVSIDLSAYSGSLLSIEFSNSSTANSNYFRIDDVQLISGTKLPIIFGNIKGFIQHQQLYMQWETIQEEGSKLFEIQISKDGKEFTTIDTVASKAVAGISQQNIEYAYSGNMRLYAGLFSMIILCTSLLNYKRNYKILLGGVCLAIVILGIACTKNSSAVIAENTKIFARIVQIDKDGNSSSSKVILLENVR